MPHILEGRSGCKSHNYKQVADGESMICKNCAHRYWLVRRPRRDMPEEQQLALWEKVQDWIYAAEAWIVALFKSDAPIITPAAKSFDWSKYIRQADEQDRKDYAENPLAFWAAPDRWEGIDKPNRRDPGHIAFWMVNREPQKVVETVIDARTHPTSPYQNMGNYLRGMQQSPYAAMGMQNSASALHQALNSQNQIARHLGTPQHQAGDFWYNHTLAPNPKRG